MADSNTEESSSVAKDDNINAISETSSADLEIQDIQGIGPTTAKKSERRRYCISNGFGSNKCRRVGCGH